MTDARNTVKEVIALLADTDLSLEDYTLLSTAVLDKLAALPFRDIITVENGSLLINGSPIDYDKASQLRGSARGVLDASAHKVIHQLVQFQATNVAMHKATDAYQLIFGRAAIWFGQQEQQFLELLAGGKDGNLPLSED